jgi:hypothetical protein
LLGIVSPLFLPYQTVRYFNNDPSQISDKAKELFSKLLLKVPSKVLEVVSKV